MGQKVNPTVFRIPYGENWRARWFHPKRFRHFLREDIAIRECIEQRLAKASVQKVEIERSPGILRVIIHTARPGMIIGRGGGGVEQLRRETEKVIKKVRYKLPWDSAESPVSTEELKLQIEEVRRPETHAVLVAKNIQEDIERRVPFRRIMKQGIEKVMQSGEVQGVKIVIKGRLDGSEMARTVRQDKGKVPLHTLRAHIDYGQVTAKTTYGAVGVKVWIYKGEYAHEKDRENGNTE